MDSSAPSLGVILSLLNLFLWGCWPYARKECNSDASKVITLLFIGESAVIVIATIVTDLLQLSQAWSGLIEALYDSKNSFKVLAIAFGGFNIICADFLVLCAFVYLPIVVALPTVIGISLGLGSLFNYLLQISDGTFNQGGKQSNQVATFLLFFSVLLAISAVIFLGQAHNYKDLSLGIYSLLDVDKINKKKWLFICVLTGFLSASWSPLVSYGNSGLDGVTDSFSRFLIYIIGQGVGLIYILLFYSSDFYEKIGLRIPSVPFDTNNNYSDISVVKLLYEALTLPNRDLFYGILCGSFLGFGYILNFAVTLCMLMISASLILNY